MNELEKINAKVKCKQIGRIIGGIGSMAIGLVLIGMYLYQAGITAGQKAISEEFPEEYAAITAKLVEAFEK